MSEHISSLNIDPYKVLHIIKNSDGSLTRLIDPPQFPACPEPSQLTHADSVSLCKDIPLNPTNKTSIRLYRPFHISTPSKLPIILFVHGGGFVLFSTATHNVHKSCSSISSHATALIVSVDYRLAPEHRLPAAYDDAMEALMWLREQALGINGCDPWLKEYGDFSRVFLMGTSAGGNVAYHVGVRVLDHDLDPLKIVGLIFDQPYFGGVERTPSEIRLVDDVIFPLILNDACWLLGLPEGCNRDHEYSNPLKGETRPVELLPRCLVRGYEDDPLVDRIKRLATMLDGHGVQVVSKFMEGGCHVAEKYDPEKANTFYDELKDFIYS